MSLFSPIILPTEICPPICQRYLIPMKCSKSPDNYPSTKRGTNHTKSRGNRRLEKPSRDTSTSKQEHNPQSLQDVQERVRSSTLSMPLFKSENILIQTQSLPRIEIQSKILRPTLPPHPTHNHLPFTGASHRRDRAQERAIRCHENVHLPSPPNHTFEPHPYNALHLHSESAC